MREPRVARYFQRHAHLLQLAVFLEEIGKLRFEVFAVPLLL
jgi:hypothetical protein